MEAVRCPRLGVLGLSEALKEEGAHLELMPAYSGRCCVGLVYFAKILISWQQWRWPCCLGMSDKCQEVTSVWKCALSVFPQFLRSGARPGELFPGGFFFPGPLTGNEASTQAVHLSQQTGCAENADRDTTRVLSGPCLIKSRLEWWLLCGLNLQESKMTFLLKIFQKYGCASALNEV